MSGQDPGPTTRQRGGPRYRARRAAVLYVLVDAGMSPELAERWCVAWEAEAERQELPRDGYFWDAGSGWIDARLAVRNRPPANPDRG